MNLAASPAPLRLSGLRVQLGGREVVRNVDLDLRRGEIVASDGPQRFG